SISARWSRDRARGARPPRVLRRKSCPAGRLARCPGRRIGIAPRPERGGQIDDDLGDRRLGPCARPRALPIARAEAAELRRSIVGRRAADGRDRARAHAQPDRAAPRRAVRGSRAEARRRGGAGARAPPRERPRDPARRAEPRARDAPRAAPVRDEQGDDRVQRHARRARIVGRGRGALPGRLAVAENVLPPTTLPRPADDAAHMAVALEEARAAAGHDDVPIGAVLARARNQREAAGDPTAHAEVLALREAGKRLGRWRLTDCALYVTLEPCVMCAGAIVLARVPLVVFGAPDPKSGAVVSMAQIFEERRLNHHPKWRMGVARADCERVLTEFFAAHRDSLAE